MVEPAGLDGAAAGGLLMSRDIGNDGDAYWREDQKVKASGVEVTWLGFFWHKRCHLLEEATFLMGCPPSWRCLLIYNNGNSELAVEKLSTSKEITLVTIMDGVEQRKGWI